MKIRPADLELDALAIMDGAEDFVQRVAFDDLLPKDSDALQAALGRVLFLEGIEVMVVEHEGAIVAGIGLLYAPYLWNPEITVAEELFWWASQDAPYRAAKALIEAAMERVRAKDAVPAFRALTTSPNGVDRLYRRLGMKPIETVYMGAA